MKSPQRDIAAGGHDENRLAVRVLHLPSSSAASRRRLMARAPRFSRSKAIFIAPRAEASVTPPPRRRCLRPRQTALRRDGAPSARRRSTCRRAARSGRRSASDGPMPLKPSGSTATSSVVGDQVMETRAPRRRPAPARLGRTACRRWHPRAKLVERLPDAGCPATISDRRTDAAASAHPSATFPRSRGGDFFAGAVAMVGQDHGRAVAGRRVTLGDRRVDGHDDGDRDAEAPVRQRRGLARQLPDAIGDDALARLVDGQLLQPPIGAAHLEGAGPLQRPPA